MTEEQLRRFNNAQIEEIKKYIQSKGGDENNQSLASEWAINTSESFRNKWKDSTST